MPRRKARGIALALTLVVILVLAVISGAIVLLGITNQSQIGQNQEETLLLHIADGGMHKAMAEMYLNPAYKEAGKGQYNTNLSQAWYWWTFEEGDGPFCVNNLDGATPKNGPIPPNSTSPVQVPPGTALLIVSASAAGVGGPSPVRVAALATSIYPYGMASDGKISIHSFTTVAGPGIIRSNKVGGNPNIAFKNNGTLNGTAMSRDADGSITGAGTSGTRQYNQPPVTIPDIPIDKIIDSWGSASGGSYGGPATYKVSTFDFIGPNNGPPTGIALGAPYGNVPLPAPGKEVSIYVDGDLTLQHSTLPRGVHLYIKGNFKVNGQLNSVTYPSPATPDTGTLDPNSNYIFVGGSTLTNGSSANNLKLFSTGDVRFNGSNEMTGFTYIRNGNLDINGNSKYRGIVLARTAPGASNGNIMASGDTVSYDPKQMPNMVPFNTSIPSPMRTLSWWVWAR